ncbi:hypothetical protein JTB14_025000 [Gonioctena quinquepunctata]|nr:hypothetical protein JTB14_025000 [Gonioctena quinquepunctata]
MYRPGSIRKIEVKNFVTYSHVELYPGPHLNMLIGPNGTGKSTIVAAIILGLGGNPKVVGRGTRVSEYVKHNCETSTINIYLQDETENQYIKVTREFDTHERSLWKLNNKKFLPQDRVQEFAKLNKQELLKETQKALCRFDLIEKQETLIKNRGHQKEILESVENFHKKLQDATELNSRLEGRVCSFNKKKKYSENIQHIDRKIVWASYEQIRLQLTEIKNDRNKAQEVYDRHKKAMKPIEKDISGNKKNITELQQSNTKIAQVIRNTESAIKDMNSKLAEIEQWDNEIENASVKLEEMMKLRSEMFAKCDSDTPLRQTLSSELNKLLGHQKILQDKKEEILQSKQDDTLKIHALENETLRIENVKQNRLRHLEKLSPDAHTAVNWLRNNKHLFRGEIYEPIMLEVNVFEGRHAKYVESVIPLRDRLAFTCVHKDDMNKLVRCLREAQNLSVNVIHSGDTTAGMSRFQPAIAIECLRRYGFYTYINNLFAAPDPIMHYLCKTYNLHNIPLGDNTTNDLYEQVPRQIRQFFSDKYRYSISFSKYSGEKSTRQHEVFSDGGLSLSLDVVKLDRLRGEIIEMKRNISKCDTQCQTLDEQFNNLSEKINISKVKIKEIHQQKQNAQAVNARIENLQKKITEMNQCKKSPESIRSETQAKRKQLLKNMPSTQDAIRNEITKLVENIKKSALILKKIEQIRKIVAYLENQMNENKRQCQDAEETLNLVKDRYAEVMSEAKSMLSKAKGLSKGFTPVDDGFDEFRNEYDSLPPNIQELNALKEQFQSRIACLNVADDDEMREYEERLSQIDKLTEEIEKLNANLNKITDRIETMKQEWLTPLKKLLAEINLQFATAFERMGCAGEISLGVGDNEKDFSQYGICIKVTYRNGEPLQELNSNIQSGGERAVATAAFMLSLQKLTPVPFRCVDEINQVRLLLQNVFPISSGLPDDRGNVK